MSRHVSAAESASKTASSPRAVRDSLNYDGRQYHAGIDPYVISEITMSSFLHFEHYDIRKSDLDKISNEVQLH